MTPPSMPTTMTPSTTLTEPSLTSDTKETAQANPVVPARTTDSDTVASVEPTTSTPLTALDSPTAPSLAQTPNTTMTSSPTPLETSPPFLRDTLHPTERDTGEYTILDEKVDTF